MTKKTPPAPSAPIAPKPAFDPKTAEFDQLLERFNRSSCDVDSYNLATHMAKAEFEEKAKALLPMVVIAPEQTIPQAIEAEQPVAPTTEPEKVVVQAIKPEKLDFNQNGKTTPHEWAAALLAAKQLKLGAGLVLSVAEGDKLIDRAEQIYKATRPETKGNDAASNGCRKL